GIRDFHVTGVQTCALPISGVIVINSGATLTVRGEIINIQEANNFVVQNNANLIQIENISNTGNIKVYRNSSLIKHLDYTSWSSRSEERRVGKEHKKREALE